jgi:hypothetical protein
MVKVKLNRSLYSPINRPIVFQEVEVLRFEDSRHIKVVRLSVPHTDYLNPQEKSVVFILVSGWVDPWAIVQAEGLYQWKIPMT